MSLPDWTPTESPIPEIVDAVFPPWAVALTVLVVVLATAALAVGLLYVWKRVRRNASRIVEVEMRIRSIVRGEEPGDASDVYNLLSEIV